MLTSGLNLYEDNTEIIVTIIAKKKTFLAKNFEDNL